MIDYQYIFATIKNFSVKYSCTPRSWQQVVSIFWGQSCVKCGLWVDGIEKQITWKNLKSLKKKNSKKLGKILATGCLHCVRVKVVSGVDTWICLIYLLFADSDAGMLENGWNLKNRLKLEKWLQHSRVPKHVTLLISLLLICCSLYLPLSTYFVGVWQTQ